VQCKQLRVWHTFAVRT